MLKVLGIIALVFVALFLLTLVIYFFNLDMKLACKMQPLLNKWYDRRKRTPFP